MKRTLLFAALCAVAAPALAQLDTDKLTCYGAERAASSDGVAAYTGKFLRTWPGLKNPYGYDPGPYAAEKSTLTVTAQNAAQHAAFLTDGQKALLQKYPQGYRMEVYPSHRDFRFEDQACEVAKKNLGAAEIIHDGKGVKGLAGAVPFPQPKSGLEAVWNIGMTRRAWSESVTADAAIKYGNGATTWGRSEFVDMSPHGPAGKPVSMQEKVAAYFYIKYLLPERDKGMTSVGYAPFDFSDDATHSWTYQPGTRRVRQSPEVGFDYPVPPAGMHTSDEDTLWNGSPERYNWKLTGKKTLYVPYHNFRVNDPAIKYADLIKPGTINPAYVRYEPHRVWIIEGTLKQGLRHVYGRRVLYADEDTWLPLWSDNYDTRGQLWRTSFVNYFYSQESATFHRGVTVYHDLNSGAYEATYLVNEAGPKGWWRLNQKFPLSMFKPEALARSGH